MAEPTEPALNSLIAPAWILQCHPFNQVGQRRVERRTPLAMRVSPVLGNQPAIPRRVVPGVTSQWRRTADAKSRGNASKNARWFQFGLGLGCCRRGAATDLMARDQQLDVFGDCRAREQGASIGQSYEDQVDQTHRHTPSSLNP